MYPQSAKIKDIVLGLSQRTEYTGCVLGRFYGFIPGRSQVCQKYGTGVPHS